MDQNQKHEFRLSTLAAVTLVIVVCIISSCERDVAQQRHEAAECIKKMSAVK